MIEDKKEIHFFKLILKFETLFFPNAFILYFAALLKFIGLMNITHSLDVIIASGKTISVHQYYTKLTLFTKANFHTFLDQYNYDILCWFIYLLIPLPWIILYIIYKTQISSSYKQTKTIKLLFKLSSLLNKVNLFLSQHVIEALAMIIFSLIKESQLKTEYEIKANNMLYSNRKYFYSIMNCIYIIIINITNYWQIALLNQPFFSAKITIQIFQGKWFQIILCLLFNCQGIGIFYLFAPNNLLLKLIINNIVSGVLLLFYFTYAQSFLSEQTILSKLVLIMVNMCFFSSLIEVYVYLCKANGMTLVEFIEKILIELLFAVIINHYSSSLIVKHLKSSLRKRLFTHQKNISIAPFLYCATVMRQSVDDNGLIYDLLIMIQEHKMDCKDSACQCTKSECRIRYEKLNKTKTEVKTKLTIKEFYLVYKEIIICFENEISKMLDSITKMNKLVRYCQVIILQIEYICYFSQNVFFTCFLIEKYLKKIKKPPFILKYQMYQLKHRAIQVYKTKLFENLYRYERKHSKEMMVFSHFLKYQQVILTIRRNLNQLASEFLNVFSLKYLKNSLSASSMCNINNVIKNCSRYETENKELQISITRNFSFYNKLFNEELCYLLTLYYTTICNRVPPYINDCISKDDVSAQSIHHINQSFNEKGMSHPIIVFVEEGRKFVIRYMCKYLMANLGYENNELIGKEISELLPKAFEESHLSVIATNILKKKPKFFENRVFCIDKRGYYVPINIAISFFPTIENNIIIIINASKRDYSDKYSFIIMDEYGTFLSYSKVIEGNFIINRDIINKVKFNFFTYFNLPETIIDPLKRSLINIRERRKKKESMTRNALIKYENDAKANIELKEISDLNFIYDKQKLNVCSEKIKNWVKESQTDLSLLDKIEKQERNFDLFQSTSNFKDNYELISKCRNQLIGMQIKLSSINKFIFFYVTLFDIDKNSSDFNNRTMRTCSVLCSNYKKDDSGVTNTKIGDGLRTRPGNKYSQKSVTVFSPSNKNKRMSIISKLLRNPQGFNQNAQGAQQQGQGGNSNININNSINNSTIQSNLNFSTSFNKNLIIKEHNEIHNQLSNSKHKQSSKRVAFQEKKNKLKRSFKIINSKDSSCQTSNMFKLIVVFDLIIIAFFSVFFYPLSLRMINNIENYCLLDYSNQLLQYLLSASSLLAINSCLVFPSMQQKKTLNVIDTDEIRLHLEQKSHELLRYLNMFHSSINSLNAYHLIDFGNIPFKILKRNWSIATRDSTLIDELLSFHYYLKTQSRSENGITQCHFDAFKFQKFIDRNDLNYEPTNDDVLIHYILENVLYKLIPQIFHVYAKINKETLAFFNSFQVMIVTYTVSFIFFFIIIVIVLYGLFNFLMNNNLDMTQKLLSEKDDLIVMTRLVMFKALINDFRYSRCEEYEKLLKETASRKKRESFSMGDEVIALLTNTNISQSLANGGESIKHSILMHNHNKSVSGLSLNNGSNFELAANKQNVMNSTMQNVSTHEVVKINSVNDSNNPDEFYNNRNGQLIRNKKEKKAHGLMREDPELIANADSSISDTQENVLALLRKNDKYTFAFRLFIFFFIILNFGVLILFLLLNLSQAEGLKKSNSIGSNHLAIINASHYLTLIYLRNVLYFNPYLNEIPEEFFTAIIFDNWYNIKPDISNTLLIALKQTIYSSTLYMLEISKGNVNTFVSMESKLMKELKELDVILDSKDFCIMSSYFYQVIEFKSDININTNIIANAKESNSLIDLFASCSKNVKACRVIGNNINKDGLSTALSTYILELNSIYKEFIYDFKLGNKNKFNDYFFFKKPLMHSMLNVIFQGDKAQIVIISTLEKEMKALHHNWRKIEGRFIIAFIFFDVLFTIVSLWFFIKLRQDYVVLMKTVKNISISITMRH